MQRLDAVTPFRSLLLIAVLLQLTGCGCANGPTEQVVIKGQTFTLEVASTTEAIKKGLGERESIPENGGMLFVFPDAQQRRFWMVDCLVDIDIMYLDALGRITAIHTMRAEPLETASETRVEYEQRLKRYSSGLSAQFAIELKADRMKELGLKTGNKIDIPIECLKARVN
jgi:uncharacterized membrane protein (UPF0127 family)